MKLVKEVIKVLLSVSTIVVCEENRNKIVKIAVMQLLVKCCDNKIVKSPGLSSMRLTNKKKHNINYLNVIVNIDQDLDPIMSQ